MKLFDRIVRYGIGDRFVGPMFRRLFLPSIIFSAAWALSDIADAVVVGQQLGTVGLAGIAMILPVYKIIFGLANGFGLGGSVMFSRLMAHGDFDRARECYAQTVLSALILSGGIVVLGFCGMDVLLQVLGATRASADVLAATREYLLILLASTPLFFLSIILNYYLYNDDCQRLAVFGAIVGNASDIALNFVLVLGCGLGMRGAALSTAAGLAISILVYGIGLLRCEHHLQFRLPRGGWLKAGFGQLRTGLSSSVSYLYQVAFFVVCNNVLVGLGGDVAVAVSNVVQNVSYVLLYIYEGASRAMQPLLATFYGENGRGDLAQTRTQATFYGCGLGLVLVLAVVIEPSVMCGIFGVAEGEVRELTELALRIYCIGAVFAGLNILDAGYFVACGVEKASLLIQSLRGAVLLLPLTVLGGLFGDIHTFWLAFPLAEIGAWALFRLVVRFRPGYEVRLLAEERIYQKTVSGSTEDVMAADREIEAFCERRSVDAKRAYAVTLAVEEICATIVKNGMKEGYICITLLDDSDGDLILILRYNDDYFNPFSLQTNMANAEGNFDMDAMGILMIRKQSKDFAYRRYQGLNSLVVRL